MGTTAVRQLLRSLCSNSQWKYAVLWKLRYENRMILSWEDGYYDHPEPRVTLETLSDDSWCRGSGDMIPLYPETSIKTGGSGESPIGQMVANMSNLQYTLGEGIVGEVAYTGNHCWVLYDDIFTSEANSKLVNEYPNEWLLQFASDIKTILLVPVLPHGVLQLGSLEAVAEDIAVVAYIKDRFAVHSAPAVDSVKVDKYTLSAFDQPVSPLCIQDALEIYRQDQLNIALHLLLGDVSTSLGPINRNQSEMVDDKLLGLSCIEELQEYSQHINFDLGVFDEFLNGTVNGDTAGHLLEQFFGDQDAARYMRMSPFLSFPRECELHKALGPVFENQVNEYLLESFFSRGAASNNSRFVCSKDLVDCIEPLQSDKGDTEYSLEAVVTVVSSSSDDNSSGTLNSLKNYTTSAGQSAASSQPENQSEIRASAGHDSVPWSPLTSAPVAQGNSGVTAFSFKSTLSTVIVKDETEKNEGYIRPRKGKKTSTMCKRSRPCENRRPRPRDRQMIQDRVKELRELVPNGSKCSIDGLLDRTVKHMLFLRSVADQAGKLKQWVDKEVTTRTNRRASEINQGYENGTSWAFEFGREFQICPIIVEDLAYPGHMLIEMLCNEPSIFLEIAQVIRSLDLTILKGEVDSHGDNTWARFVVEVEATEGFHRLDIFWPLMQILQCHRNIPNVL
ncbi:transcription factor EMB1444-like [Carica papaya]|uniref:transcription factor EMB1444-like n=1 Tax=Carica papaya TaxID=3649 RepID=UPI000B8CD4B8|nr:transcription factor EMB1444-like [Carica papaya]